MAGHELRQDHEHGPRWILALDHIQVGQQRADERPIGRLDHDKLGAARPLGPVGPEVVGRVGIVGDVDRGRLG